MAAILTATILEPISRQKMGFILVAIVSEFDLKRPNDSEDFQKYFIELAQNLTGLLKRTSYFFSCRTFLSYHYHFYQ